MRHHDVVQLLHVNTNTLLLTHDVASPLMPTNQEFTTVATDNAERYNETLFQLDVFDAHEGEPLKSLSGHFKLRHQPTRVLLWTHATPLPEWAFGQQEVNGNKNNQDRSTFWFIDDIVADGTGTDFRNRTTHVEPKAPKRRSFIKKFVELQILMLQHNAALTSSHPYASESIEWPFCLSGVSFWTNNDEQQQIYMIGNLLGWWICAVSVSVFVGIVGADMLARRRGMEPIEEGKSIPSFLCTLRILPKAAHDPRAGIQELQLTNRPSEQTLPQHPLLPRYLVIPLLPLFPHVASKIPASLSPRAPRLGPRRWRRAQFRTGRSGRLPRQRSGHQDAPKAGNGGEGGQERVCSVGGVDGGGGGVLVVVGAFYLWDEVSDICSMLAQSCWSRLEVTMKGRQGGG